MRPLQHAAAARGSSGSIFSASHEPPGRSGASHSSHASAQHDRARRARAAATRVRAARCRAHASFIATVASLRPSAMHSRFSCSVIGASLCGAGGVARAVRRAAALRRGEIRLGVGQARRSACRDAAAAASSRASVVSCPPCIDEVEVNTAAGLPASAPFSHSAEVRVEKMLERRGHVAEARRRAEREAGALREVRELGVRRAGVGHRGCASLRVDRRHRRHRAQPRASRLRPARRRARRAAPSAAPRRGGCNTERESREVMLASSTAGIIVTQPPMTFRVRRNDGASTVTGSTPRLIDLGRIVMRRFYEDRCMQIASSLTFTSLLVDRADRHGRADGDRRVPGVRRA